MSQENGITFDLFPPQSWDEEGIKTALEIQEAADGEDGWGFNEAELSFIARSVAYYMNMAPTEWGTSFEIDTDIEIDHPLEDGRYIINMCFPGHLEPPASLR